MTKKTKVTAYVEAEYMRYLKRIVGTKSDSEAIRKAVIAAINNIAVMLQVKARYHYLEFNKYQEMKAAYKAAQEGKSKDEAVVLEASALK